VPLARGGEFCIVDERTGKRWLTTYELTRADAERPSGVPSQTRRVARCASCPIQASRRRTAGRWATGRA